MTCDKGWIPELGSQLRLNVSTKVHIDQRIRVYGELTPQSKTILRQAFQKITEIRSLEPEDQASVDLSEFTWMKYLKENWQQDERRQWLLRHQALQATTQDGFT
jgi:hypothetical protein